MIRLPHTLGRNWALALPKLHIGQWLGAIGELCVPTLCVGCSAFAVNGWACELCMAKAELASPEWCRVCSMPVGEPHSVGCRHGSGQSNLKRNNYLPWVEARCLGAYAGVIRSACLSGKKSSGAWASAHLVQEWWARHGDWAASIGPAWLVPIPRHWSRRLLEGHDPAEFIARTLATRWSACGGRMARLLTRQKATPHLSELTAEKRFLVMSGLFATSRDSARRFSEIPNVVLVDDIWTSGATAISAAQCLKQAGAKSIYLATMARTLERHA